MSAPLALGRYVLHEAFASGGMASVHLGRLVGPVGFSRTVAIKRLHKHLASDPEFVTMFLDEARLAARVRHPNVVPTLDVVAMEGEVFLVMEYVQGESLSYFLKRARKDGLAIDLRIVVQIVASALHGLHAAHEAKDERGEPLDIVHRDVSPQNVIVGADGVARVVDFGVAKATGRAQETRTGQVKGKLQYMAPEQMKGKGVTRAADIYAAGVVLWEALANARLFAGTNDVETMYRALEGAVAPPSATNPAVTPALDAIVRRALEKEPQARFATAEEFAAALESSVPSLPGSTIAAWVKDQAADALAERAKRVEEVESDVSDIAALPLLADTSGARASAPSLSARHLVPAEPLTTVLTPASHAGVATPERLSSIPPFARRRSRVPFVVAGSLLAVLIAVFVATRGEPAPAAAPSKSAAPPPSETVAADASPPSASSSATAAAVEPVTSESVKKRAPPPSKPAPPVRPPTGGIYVRD